LKSVHDARAGHRAGFFRAAPAESDHVRHPICDQKERVSQTMPFQKGQSGNPAGRPRGSRNRSAMLLQNLLADDGEAIARRAIAMAKEGDIAAIRMCLDRLVPARRSDAVAFELPPLAKAADSVAAAAAIVAAVAAGDLTPSEAGELAKVIDVYVRALETAGFEERLQKLESRVSQ
jgi:hypothetical protein